MGIRRETGRGEDIMTDKPMTPAYVCTVTAPELNKFLDGAKIEIILDKYYPSGQFQFRWLLRRGDTCQTTIPATWYEGENLEQVMHRLAIQMARDLDYMVKHDG